MARFDMNAVQMLPLAEMALSPCSSVSDVVDGDGDQHDALSLCSSVFSVANWTFTCMARWPLFQPLSVVHRALQASYRMAHHWSFEQALAFNCAILLDVSQAPYILVFQNFLDRQPAFEACLLALSSKSLLFNGWAVLETNVQLYVDLREIQHMDDEMDYRRRMSDDHHFEIQLEDYLARADEAVVVAGHRDQTMFHRSPSRETNDT